MALAEKVQTMTKAPREENIEDKCVTTEAAPRTEASAVNIAENPTQQDINKLENEMIDNNTILANDSGPQDQTHASAKSLQLLGSHINHSGEFWHI